MTDRYGGSQIAGEGQCWVVFCPSAMGPRAKAPGGGALAARGATRPQAAAGNKKILRRERPVYPKTGQSHPKKQLRYVWPLLPLRGHHHHEIQ